MLWAKASPGGEAGSPQGLTDEVEATNDRHKLVRHCYLRPHPVRLEPDHLPLQGKAFFASPGSAYEIRAHRGMPPHLHSKTVVPTAPHPSRAMARATFPQGKAPLRSTGRFHRGAFLSFVSAFFVSGTWLRGSYVHKICTTCF